LQNVHGVNTELDTSIAGLLHVQPHKDQLERRWFVGLPHDVAREVTHAWLRAHDVQDINRKSVERLIVFMKTGKLRQQFPVDKRWQLIVKRDVLALEALER
jgi:hypothetical protein